MDSALSGVGEVTVLAQIVMEARATTSNLPFTIGSFPVIYI